MKINTKDEIVLAVLKKMDQRSIIGQQKYVATMMQEIVGEEKDLNRFLVDVQEELMDAILYIQAAREELQDLSEEDIIRKSACASHAIQQDEDELEERMNIVGQNGNDGLHYDESHDGYMLDNDEIWGEK